MATSLKARVMLTLCYGCGLRAGEVVRLTAGDIDSEQMIIRIVQSKGRKDRHVMLPEEVLDLLRQWWKERPTDHDAAIAPAQRWLFPGRCEHRGLTTRQFNRLLKDAAKAAGLKKPITLHTLRQLGHHHRRGLVLCSRRGLAALLPQHHLLRLLRQRPMCLDQT
jgi:integrase